MQESYFEDQQLLSKIRESDNSAVVELYRLHRDGFIHWAQQNYKVDEENAADIFQDTVVSLHTNIMKGKLTELNSSLKTYLYAVGKNIIGKKLHKMDVVAVGHQEDLPVHFETEVIDQLTVNDRQRVVATILETMGEPCKTILRLFYFKGLSMDAIATAMEYKNENIANTQKLRCVSTLKQMIRERYNSTDF